jgi:hypothetical protein
MYRHTNKLEIDELSKKIMTSVIQVTQDDIEHGIKADCYYCPVALALERTLGAVDVRVYHGSADWMIPPKWFAWRRRSKW